MSTAFRDISAALDQQLSIMSGLPPVAWENQEYEPTLGTLWLRATNLQGETLAVTENDRTVGVYQIDIFSELNVGKSESMTMADLIVDHFKQDSELTYNGVMVRVNNVSKQASRRTEDGWLQTIIEVFYYSFTARR